MARIRRAQAKGKADVKLNKDELGALERRRDRLQREEERRRRKEEKQRYAIPISHLEPALPKRRTRAAAAPDALPRHPTPTNLSQQQAEPTVYPPMGRFTPPNATRTRQRSGTSTSSQRPPSRSQRGDSPFSYSYVNQPPSNSRHVSDPQARPQSAYGPLPHEDDWTQHQHGVDPFQFMTAGARAPYHAGAGSMLRHSSGPPSETSKHGSRNERRHVSNDGSTTEEEDDEDEDTNSDDRSQGARVRSRGSSTRGRDQIVVEVNASPSPEPEPAPVTRSKKSSGTQSPVKRKPVGGGGKGKRKGR